ncbi:sigma-54 interaction domain-containing protein [Salipaludibacillus sp. CF4.18]|uniref:sigma-54 interaction domain-containing protein n=1 Tax=Salipaludibacillus sp. CF4.18 TaxID=3373081 RepID=UPI003EE4E4F2
MKKQSLQNYKMIINLLDILTDAIYIADNEGNTLWLNKASEALNGPKEKLIGKNVKELETTGYFNPSVIRLTLEAGHDVSVIQTFNEGKKYLVTGHIVANEGGETELLVAHGRDLTEAVRMSTQFKETKELLKQYTKELQEMHTGNRKKTLDNKVIGKSSALRSLLNLIKKFSEVDATVLVTGETGVGKTFIAKQIHQLSARKDEALVKINCGSIPESLLESELFGYKTGAFTGASKGGKAGLVKMAEKGTLFLDEIGELPLHLQAKILQLIQDKTYLPIGDTKWQSADVRIIAATNLDLENMIEEKKLRSDLYYRLNVLPIKVPPLRERQEDIYHLANVFLNKFNENYQQDLYFSKKVLEYFQNYNWPGNIRELENLIERLVIITKAGEISEEDLPERIKEATAQPLQFPTDIDRPLPEMVEELEKAMIIKAAKSNNSTRKIAKSLGITQSSLLRRLRKYNIKI